MMLLEKVPEFCVLEEWLPYYYLCNRCYHVWSDCKKNRHCIHIHCVPKKEATKHWAV